MYKPDICIYHANCNDGMGAAYVVHQASAPVENIEYIPCQYGEPVPDLDYVGKDVIIVDFSFKKPDLEKIALVANSVVVLDHHKTAEENLKDFTMPFTPLTRYNVKSALAETPTNIVAVFDMAHSGAMMTWNFMFPHVRPPLLIEYVQDRDMWRFNYNDTAAVHLHIKATCQSFKDWDALKTALEYSPHEVLTQACAIKLYHEKLVKEVAQTGTLGELDHLVPWLGPQDKVAFVHCPYALVSDTCDYMLRQMDWGGADPQVAVAVVEAYGKVTYSLRGKGTIDVSAIASRFGGGGHHDAAGFRYDSRLPAKG